MADRPRITGLFETHLLVRDLERSVGFYRDVVGLELAYEVPERNVAFLWIGAPGQSMLGLWGIGSAPMGMELHVAFEVELEDLLEAPRQLHAQKVTPYSFFGEETEEPTVIGWMPAATLYFRDPDGNLLEYLAMLDIEPRPDLGIIPYSEWTASTSSVTR
jgi:lactoylglutathione lyase